MKSSKFSVRDGLALLIALLSLGGLVVMFNAEGNMVLSQFAAPMTQTLQEYNGKVLPNLQAFSLAFGCILLAVSIAFILLGHEEEISTALNEADRKK